MNNVKNMLINETAAAVKRDRKIEQLLERDKKIEQLLERDKKIDELLNVIEDLKNILAKKAAPE